MADRSPHIVPDHLNDIETLEDVLGFFAGDLDWPISADDLEDASFEYEPEDLGIAAERIPRLRSIRQMRPLTTGQPWGVFFLEFEGPRLPITPLRQLLRALVTRKRAGRGAEHRTWELSDLLFIITTADRSGVELHLVAFETADDGSVQIFSLPWRPHQSPPQHLRRLAEELLPRLAWPDDPSDAAAWRDGWHSAFALRPGAAIKSAKALAERMASVAHDVRQRVDEIMAAPAGNEPLVSLYDEVREQLIPDLDPNRFADTCAQTLVYGLLSSRITDPIGFGASPVLAVVPLANPFLDAFFERIHDRLHDPDGADGGLGPLIADLRATNVESILDQFGATTSGADPVIHFYEEFLKAYDPGRRAEAGAFYTPQPVVQYMTRAVDEVLRTRFRMPLGLADGSTWGQVAESLGIPVPSGVSESDPFISVIDPATGTGTFLVEWMRQARRSFVNAGRSDTEWPTHLRDTVLPAMVAFELMPAPYAIAHLKTALEAHSEGLVDGSPRILLTDALEHPSERGQTSLDPFIDPVAFEGAVADELKSRACFSVVIGNPPYRRLTRAEAGGWVVHGAPGADAALFDVLVETANKHTIFSHVASLYNLYTYFWRWALWTAFERLGDGPGVVALITASSWLHGPGFIGLRQLACELSDEIFILDLGGEGHGNVAEENVFDIQTPVAIAILFRTGQQTPGADAKVWYRRLGGTRQDKLAFLADEAQPLASAEWTPVEGPVVSMVARDSDDAWDSWPTLDQILPWHQPGAMLNRTWPVAPDEETLARRWTVFLADSSPERRSTLFPDPKSGRQITSQVGNLPKLADLPAGAPHPPVAPYLWRAFDVQHIFRDPRLAKTESPSLWQTVSDKQVFLVTDSSHVRGPGPLVFATTAPPDKHAFCGRGGKDVVPLFRDHDAVKPNLTADIAQSWADHIGVDHVEATEVLAYVVAIAGNPSFTKLALQRHAGEPLRLPLTSSPAIFDRAVALGARLTWLQTLGARFVNEAEGRPGEVHIDPELSLSPATPVLPDGPGDVRYDPEMTTVYFGDNTLAGVALAAWEFEVNGWPVLRRWLEHRTRAGRGRRTSELNDIRPTSWDGSWTNELLTLVSVLHGMGELQSELDDLLNKVLAGPTIDRSHLPVPTNAETKVPPTDLQGTTPSDGALF